MKFYGVTVSVKQNDKGIWFAQVKSMNEKDKDQIYTISSYSKQNNFGGQKLSANDRFSATLSGDSAVKKVEAFGKMYEAKKQTGKKNKNVGIQVGHSINAGILLTNATEDFDVLIGAAKIAHDATESLKEKVKDRYTDLDDYSFGAMTGASILNACKYVQYSYGSDSGADIENIIEKAEEILGTVVPEVTKYVEAS